MSFISDAKKEFSKKFYSMDRSYAPWYEIEDFLESKLNELEKNKYSLEEIIAVLKWFAEREDSLNYLLKSGSFERHFKGYSEANKKALLSERNNKK